MNIIVLDIVESPRKDQRVPKARCMGHAVIIYKPAARLHLPHLLLFYLCI